MYAHFWSHLSQIFPFMQNMYQAKDKDGDHVNGEGHQKHEEVAIISTSNAVVHPGTVVIKCFNTVVAHRAM